MNRSEIVENIAKSLKPGDISIIMAECRNWIDDEAIPEHQHPDFYQIDLFHGQGQVRLGEEQFDLSRWGLVIVPPGTPHAFQAGVDGRFRNIGIKVAINCPAMAEIPAFCLANGASHRLEQIQRDLQSILQEWQLRGLAGQFLMQTRCMSLLLEFLRMWVEAEDQIPSQGIVQDACQFMALHYSQPLTVSQLARHCGVRPESLCRAFRRIIEVSPRRYLTDLRARQARALLDSGMSVTETARQTGFASIHYFSRTFRKLMGISPRQWTVRRAVYQSSHSGRQESSVPVPNEMIP